MKRGNEMENTIVYDISNPMPKDKFAKLFDIMESSFPKNEHGSAELHFKEMSRPEFRSLCYEPDGLPAAFMNYYYFPEQELIFLEHFAVKQELRGKGIGAQLMNVLKELTSSSMIVLEVEPPEGEIERRRIAFYRRQGFYLNNGDYFQPDFYGSDSKLPLKLMSTEPMDDAQFDEVMKFIHKRAYLR